LNSFLDWMAVKEERLADDGTSHFGLGSNNRSPTAGSTCIGFPLLVPRVRFDRPDRVRFLGFFGVLLGVFGEDSIFGKIAESA